MSQPHCSGTSQTPTRQWSNNHNVWLLFHLLSTHQRFYEPKRLTFQYSNDLHLRQDTHTRNVKIWSLRRGHCRLMLTLVYGSVRKNPVRELILLHKSTTCTPRSSNTPMHIKNGNEATGHATSKPISFQQQLALAHIGKTQCSTLLPLMSILFNCWLAHGIHVQDSAQNCPGEEILQNWNAQTATNQPRNMWPTRQM